MLFRIRLAQIIGLTTLVALPIAVATKKMLALSNAISRLTGIIWTFTYSCCRGVMSDRMIQKSDSATILPPLIKLKTAPNQTSRSGKLSANQPEIS